MLSGKHLDEATVENLAENFEKICEFDEKTLKLNDIQDATARVMEAVIKDDSLVNKGKAFPVQMYLKYFGKKQIYCINQNLTFYVENLPFHANFSQNI